MSERPKLHYDIQPPNLRQFRADQFTQMVMRVIEPYLDQYGEHDVRKYAQRDLFKLFSDIGADIVTDLVRSELGLPLRGDEGWTPDELRAIEHRRLEAMLSPPVFMSLETTPAPRRAPCAGDPPVPLHAKPPRA